MRWAFAPLLAAAAVAAAVVPVAAVPAAAANLSVPAHPRFASSAPYGTWRTGALVLDNDAWTPAAGPQTIWADAPGDWGIESTQPAGNRVVMSYPNVAENFSDVPVSTFSIIRTGYAESMPAGPGLDAEAADDVWLNGRQIEVMIWVDNHRQHPAGAIIGHATILGQEFSVWHRGRIWTFLLNHHQAVGQTHILGALRWLISRRDIPASATLAQIAFGWEIVSTGGAPGDFTMTGYWLTS